jgi:hypothetical protein
MDREKAKWEPAKLETIPAAVGWNMDDPMDPREIKTRRIEKVGATPTRGTKIMVRRGPPRTKKRVR